MEKTSEEIRKGLAECSSPIDGTNHCPMCPYYGDVSGAMCVRDVTGDALARINELEYALALMVNQYCREKDYVTHNCMMAGEHAFAALGIDDYTDGEKIDEMLDRMEGPT